MPAQTARMFQHETDESFARVSRSRSDRIRSITYLKRPRWPALPLERRIQ